MKIDIWFLFEIGINLYQAALITYFVRQRFHLVRPQFAYGALCTLACWAYLTLYLFVDMPPGTGDVPLTVFQTLPVDGIVVVTSPQELVSMIVGKAVKMAQMMNIPILGVVENMSYLVCPDCGKKIPVFGDSHLEETADKYGVKVLAKMPLDPQLTACADGGAIETYAGDALAPAADAVAALLGDAK